MTKSKLKNALAAAALLLLVASISSCNRGYGCPNNFSVEQTSVNLVNSAVSSLFKK